MTLSEENKSQAQKKYERLLGIARDVNNLRMIRYYEERLELLSMTKNRGIK